MKNKIIKAVSLSFAVGGLMAFTFRTQKVTLTKKWETEAILKVPESVIYDAVNKAIYAANIDGKPWDKDGAGSIAKISTSGKVENVEWIKGFDAPKGMGIYKNKLYVADVSKIVIVDIATAKIEKSIEVEGAENLNDITIDGKGNVYISDTAKKKIFILTDGKVTVWRENSEWVRPNGLLALPKSVKFIDMGSGNFYDIPYDDQEPKIIAKGVPSGDGIVEIGKDEFLISNWNGEVNYVKDGVVEKVLDTKEAKFNAADIWYIPSEKLVLVPTFFGNTVAAYSLVKE
jgi:hypothetical protein